MIELLKSYDCDIATHDKKEAILKATIERAKTMVELKEQIELILNAPKEYDSKAVQKAFKADTKEMLSSFIEDLTTIRPSSSQAIHALMNEFLSARGLGFGKLGQPLRIALLGAMSGSGLDEIIDIISIDETKARVQRFIESVEVQNS
jgi:glutamyl-tRNA synthetase